MNDIFYSVPIIKSYILFRIRAVCVRTGKIAFQNSRSFPVRKFGVQRLNQSQSAGNVSRIIHGAGGRAEAAPPMSRSSQIDFQQSIFFPVQQHLILLSNGQLSGRPVCFLHIKSLKSHAKTVNGGGLHKSKNLKKMNGPSSLNCSLSFMLDFT